MQPHGDLPFSPHALATRLVQATGITLGGDLFAKLLYFATQLLVARLVGAEEFGLYTLAIVIASVSFTFADLGLAKSALRYFPVFRVRDELAHIKGLAILILVVPLAAGIMVATVLALGAERIASWVSKPELESVVLPAAAAVPLMAGTIASLEATRAFGHARFFVYAKQIVHPAANLVFVLLLAQPRLTAERALWAWVAATGLAFLLSLVYLRRTLPSLKGIRARHPGGDLVRYAAPALGVNLMNYLYVRVDILVLGFLVSAQALGVYSAASQVVLAFAIAALAAQALFAPMAAELWERSRTAELRHLYRSGSRWITYLGLPILLLVCLAPANVLSIFGPDYVAGAGALIVLAVSAFFGSAISLGGPLLLMTGHQLRELGNTSIAVLANVLLNLLLVPLLGILGAAMATGVTLVGINVVRSLQVHSRLDALPITVEQVRGLIIAAIAFLTAVLVGQLAESTTLRLALQLPTALAVLASGLWAYGLSEEDRALLGAFLRARRSRPM